jgi:hypothetical protein
MMNRETFYSADHAYALALHLIETLGISVTLRQEELIYIVEWVYNA